jgi:RNA-binding protein YlmH
MGDDSDAFEDLERITKESLEKYQIHFMALKQMLKKQEESETTEKVIRKDPIRRKRHNKSRD